jgi:hypothetical protein
MMLCKLRFADSSIALCEEGSREVRLLSYLPRGSRFRIGRDWPRYATGRTLEVMAKAVRVPDKWTSVIVGRHLLSMDGNASLGACHSLQ